MSKVPNSQSTHQDSSLANYRRSLIPEEDSILEQQRPQIVATGMSIYESGRLVCKADLHTHLHFQLQEDRLYDVEVEFLLGKAVVYGLKVCNSIFKSIFRLTSEQYRQGTFAPASRIQTARFSIKAPGGMLGRGTYRGQACIKDKQETVYCELSYDVEIVKTEF